MTREGYECRIEKYDSYVEDELHDRLTPAIEYSVGCRLSQELMLELTEREEFLADLETIEINNEAEELCPMEPSKDGPTSEELRGCEDMSSWQASDELEAYVSSHKLTEADRQRLLSAITRAIEITLNLGPERIGIMNRNGVKLWKAFDILARIGRTDDGVSVPTLMTAIHMKNHEHHAIEALQRIAPGSNELKEARNLTRPRLQRYLNGTVDLHQNGRMVESRISYYSAIRIIAPDSDMERAAWHNICGNWDEYPDQPWVVSYLGKLEAFCESQAPASDDGNTAIAGPGERANEDDDRSKSSVILATSFLSPI